MRHTAKERVIKTLITSSIFLLLLQGCKPQAVETEFNALITPPSGDDQVYTTMEDQPIEVSYTPVGNDNSIELWSKISKRPRNGQLEKCVEGEGGKVTCVYVPNKNFNGKDSVVISQGDGKLISEKSPVLEIKVLPINDAPEAKDLTTGFVNSDKLIYEFQAPLAYDPDSAAQDLQYEILNSDGADIECFLGGKGDRRCALELQDKGFEGEYQVKYRVTDQENLASNEAVMNIDFSRKEHEAEVVFSQKEEKDAKGVDIVWVIDNSGSMRDEQEALKANFQSFINNFIVDGKARFDFKMGVATTDEHDRGDEKLETEVNTSNKYDLTATKAESDFVKFKEDFEKAVLVGVHGSGTEKAMTSLDLVYKNEPAWFSKNDRMLVAIILSDEKEQSTEKSPEEWSDHFKGLRTDPDLVKIYPIVNIAADNGERYKLLAQTTGGLRYSINAPFDGVLDQISNAVAVQLLSTFSINPSHEVISGTLKVTVNDQLAKPGLEYTLENNKIVFVTPPEAGAEVKVRYSYKWK